MHPICPLRQGTVESDYRGYNSEGAHLKSQDAFNTADELAELTYRLVRADVRSSDGETFVVFSIDVLRDDLALPTLDSRPGDTIAIDCPESGEKSE